MVAPVMNQISISTKESIKTVCIIHFVIVVDAIESSPDKNKAC